jgi:hypothetical protein
MAASTAVAAAPVNGLIGWHHVSSHLLLALCNRLNQQTATIANPDIVKLVHRQKIRAHNELTNDRAHALWQLFPPSAGSSTCHRRRSELMNLSRHSSSVMAFPRGLQSTDIGQSKVG